MHVHAASSLHMFLDLLIGYLCWFHEIGGHLYPQNILPELVEAFAIDHGTIYCTCKSNTVQLLQIVEDSIYVVAFPKILWNHAIIHQEVSLIF